jgi:3-oxoacyl-[acyl-carrier protein] reductase
MADKPRNGNGKNRHNGEGVEDANGHSIMRLSGKVAIITGAGSGIGQATAVKFGKEGATVISCDINADRAQETAQLVTADGGEATGYQMDVRDKENIAQVVEAVVAKYGRVDCLVNNAGIVQDATIRNMTDEQFDSVIEVNLKGVYNCTKAVVDVMIKQNSGVILNASSIVGLYGNFGQTNYAASKFGVIGMVKTWARELGRKGIRANAVCPGFVATPILSQIPEKVLKALEERVPLGRLARPEEIANTFAFLASDEASYINGAVIEVSGGLTI